MSDNKFPLEQISKLAKIAINPQDRKLQQDFNDIMQLINHIQDYDISAQQQQPTRPAPYYRRDIVDALNRRGRNILLAPENSELKYYQIPLVIQED